MPSRSLNNVDIFDIGNEEEDAMIGRGRHSDCVVQFNHTVDVRGHKC